MNLMFDYGIVNRLKHGVGVEGEGAWRHGPRFSSKCPPLVNALWYSGLLKLFCTSPKWSTVRLLEFLINYQDHDFGAFEL